MDIVRNWLKKYSRVFLILFDIVTDSADSVSLFFWVAVTSAQLQQQTANREGKMAHHPVRRQLRFLIIYYLPIGERFSANGYHIPPQDLLLLVSCGGKKN